MGKVLLGKIVSFHGVKGEVRILSDFPYKEKAFLIGSYLQIGNKSYKITSYRVHKQYDMVTFEGIIDLNSALHLRGEKVYKNKEELSLTDEEYLDEELLSCKVYDQDNEIGEVVEVFYASEKNKVIRVISGLDSEKKEFLLPLQSPFVNKIDVINKRIVVTLIEGMKW